MARLLCFHNLRLSNRICASFTGIASAHIVAHIIPSHTRLEICILMKTIRILDAMFELGRAGELHDGLQSVLVHYHRLLAPTEEKPPPDVAKFSLFRGFIGSLTLPLGELQR